MAKNSSNVAGDIGFAVHRAGTMQQGIEQQPEKEPSW